MSSGLENRPSGYYVYSVNEDRVEEFSSGRIGTGVEKKVSAQIMTMRAAGITCNLKIMPARQTLGMKILESLPLRKSRVTWNTQDIVDADFIYIRKPDYINYPFIHFLSELRDFNPRAVILLEIPTYPYDQEAKGLKHLPLLHTDRKYRKCLVRYVDYIVDLFGYKTIFGIPTVHICNGICVRDEDIKRPSGDIDTIMMVCSAQFAFWNGIDRLLVGMGNYYHAGGSRSMHLTLIGDGAELPNLKRIVDEQGLSSYVTFTGRIPSFELRQYYDRSNLGVDSLARHRTGNTGDNSSLKSRDYLNAGLPFFGEGNVDVFRGEKFPYYLQIPSNDSPINMEGIVSFFDSVYQEQTEASVIRQIHDFAWRKVDMTQTFAGVIDVIKAGMMTDIR